MTTDGVMMYNDAIAMAAAFYDSFIKFVIRTFATIYRLFELSFSPTVGFEPNRIR